MLVAWNVGREVRLLGISPLKEVISLCQTASEQQVSEKPRVTTTVRWGLPASGKPHSEKEKIHADNDSPARKKAGFSGCKEKSSVTHQATSSFKAHASRENREKPGDRGRSRRSCTGERCSSVTTAGRCGSLVPLLPVVSWVAGCMHHHLFHLFFITHLAL